jgi:hypothetical protein
MDMNISNSSKILRNVTGNWQPTIFQGSLLIRPVFSTGLNYTLRNNETPETNVTVYPNPASSSVTFSGLTENSEILIIDLQGKIIHSSNSVNESITLDVSMYERGIYLVRVNSSSGIETRKIILQ